MNDKKRLSLPSILTIIFVLAKLFGIINWSWWVVFAPFWVSALIGLLILGLLSIVNTTAD